LAAASLAGFLLAIGISISFALAAAARLFRRLLLDAGFGVGTARRAPIEGLGRPCASNELRTSNDLC
jgi:hypothetical protein